MTKKEQKKLKRVRNLIAIKLIKEMQIDFELNDDESDIGYSNGRTSALSEVIAIIDEVMLKG